MAYPRQFAESDAVIERLRRLCLALGRVVEEEAWGEHAFRALGGSMFAITDGHCHPHRPFAVWIKISTIIQDILLNSQTARYFNSPRLAAKGWIGVRLDDEPDWSELVALLADGYLRSVWNRPSWRKTRPLTPKMKREPRHSGCIKVPQAP